MTRDPSFRPAVLNLARLDVGDRRFDDARRRLNELLSKRHDDPDVLYEFGLLEQRAGRAEEAIRHLQKANEVQRRDPRAGMALIEVQLGQHQADQALATAKELASRYPDNIAVLLAFGRTQLAVGDNSGARNAFQGATRLAEFDPGTQIVIAHLQLAAGNPSGASYNVQKALLGRPDDPAAMALVVEIEARRGDAPKADAALKALNAKHPTRAETAVATANLAMSRGQYAAAVAACRAALSRDETTANALNLARAYVAAGEAAKGGEVFSKDG